MITEANALLRGEGPYTAGRGVVPWRQLVSLVIVGGVVYGAAMGAFGARALQAFYSASKVPLLLGCATLVCLPSFDVVNVLLGLRDDFSAACRGVFAAQATLAVVLAALAPLTCSSPCRPTITNSPRSGTASCSSSALSPAK